MTLFWHDCDICKDWICEHRIYCFLMDAHAVGINTQKELCSIAYKELN